MSRHPQVVHLDEVEPSSSQRGERYACTRRALGRAAGGQQLGCSHMVVPPGKRAWPRHWHAANEEAVYVLSGIGTLRLGEEQLPLRPGDYVALPAGGPPAHQVVNTGPVDLIYLVMSTMVATDITVYPDSGKVGLFAGAAPGGDKAARSLSTFLDRGAELDYWEGE